jgi:hypothetical protein
MRKLPLLLLVLLGTCVAQDQHAFNQLHARTLIVFAPDANGADFKKQLVLIERHSFELSIRNTVVVPISTASRFGEEKFSFENLPIATAAEQADARRRFHVQPGEFLVILLDENGTEQIRSASPVDIHELTASIDSLPTRH